MNALTSRSSSLQRYSTRNIFLVVLITSLVVSALIAVGIFLFGTFGQMETRILLTTVAVGGFSLTGLCSSLLYDRRRLTVFAVVGMLAAVIGFLVTIGAVWEMVSLGDVLWKAVELAIILSFSLAHSSLLLLGRSEHALINWLLTATLACVVVIAVMLSYLVVSEFNNISEFFFRLIGVFAVLDVLGTILVPIIRKAKGASVPAIAAM